MRLRRVMSLCRCVFKSACLLHITLLSIKVALAAQTPRPFNGDAVAPARLVFGIHAKKHPAEGPGRLSRDRLLRSGF